MHVEDVRSGAYVVPNGLPIRRRRNAPAFAHAVCELTSGGHTQLAEDVGHVGRDGSGRDPQRNRDLLVGLAGGDESRDVALAPRQFRLAAAPVRAPRRQTDTLLLPYPAGA